MLLLGSLALACSDESGGDLGPRPGAPIEPAAPTDAKCTAGDTRRCKIVIGEEGGVLTCYLGTQLCDDEGVWGPCGDGFLDPIESLEELADQADESDEPHPVPAD